MTLTITLADYANLQHCRDIGFLLDQYARDPMGGGAPLPAAVVNNVAAELGKLPYAFSLLGYVEGEPVGLVNGFESFSTFLCRRILNIHDIFVLSGMRGRGFSQSLLTRVEELARERGCCKLTLEVLEGNHAAQRAYRRFGFAGYELDPAQGKALFWQKSVQPLRGM